MATKVIYPIVAALGIAAASGAAWWYQNKTPDSATTSKSGPATATAAAPGPGASAPRAPGVEAVRVVASKLTDDMQAVGSLRSRQGGMVRPEVSGRITQLNFRDGDRVRKGQLLVQLDDQLSLAQVQQSQAELSIAQANHKRNQDLVEQNFISKRSVDESSANLEVALAKLALSKASAARLKILAPFDGIVGIRTASVGDYLKDGADVVNLEDIDAVFVDFRLPERFQNKVKKGQSASVSLDALPGAKFVALVQAVDPLIDANGRSVGVRGCIDNRQLRLRPGMFARVTTVFSERENALVIPEEAIVPQGQRVLVYKVVDSKTKDGKDEKIAQRVEVKLGIRRPGRVEVLEGLQAGDLVVTAGQQRLQRDGMAVRLIDTAREGGPPGGREGGPPGAPAGGASQPRAADAAPGVAVAASAASAATGPAPVLAAAPFAAPSGRPGAPTRPPGKPMEGPNPCLASADDAAAAPAGAMRPTGGKPGGAKPAGRP